MQIRALAALLVVAASPLFADTLRYVNRSTAADRQLILRRDGARLLIVEGGSETVLASAPVATTDRVVVHGASGAHNDTLTVDLTQPITLSRGIDYDGGAAGWDTLVLRGGSTQNQRVTQLTPRDGVLDLDGLVLRYTNLEPITDTAPAANFTVVGTAGPDFVTITDGPGGTTTISSSSFESVTFANKTNVVFDGLGGNDTVEFNNPTPATGLVSLIVTNVDRVSQTGAVAYSSLGINATGFVTLPDFANDVDRIEITTQNDHINYVDANDLIVGGVSPALAGVRAVQSGSVSVATLGGNLMLDDADGTEIIRAGTLSGDIVLSAGGASSDISVWVDRQAAIAPSGFIYMVAHHDILLGTGGATFANDVRAARSVTLQAQRSLSVGGLTTVMSDAFGLNSGDDVTVFVGDTLTQTGGAKFIASGTNSADVNISTGTGQLQFQGTTVGAEAVSGDVSLTMRGLTIAPTSGITAPLGQVSVGAQGMSLGTIVDVPGSPVELSDAELDRLIAPVVSIRDFTGPFIDVTQPITFTSGRELILLTPASVTVTGPGSLTAPVLTFEIPSFTPLTWVISPTAIQTGHGTPVPYSGVGTLNARATALGFAFPSDAEDTFLVTPSPTTTINIDGHLPAPPARPGDILYFDLTGLANPVLNATFTANGYEGSLTSTNRQPVNFQAIEQLANPPAGIPTLSTAMMGLLAGLLAAVALRAAR